MQKILKVAQREYAETVKTKTFILGVLMTPAIIGAIIFFTSRVFRSPSGARPPVRVAVTDRSKELSTEVNASFDKYNESHPERQILIQDLNAQENLEAVETEGKNRLRQSQIEAYVVLDKDILAGAGKIHLYTYKPKASDLDVLGTIEGRLNSAVVNQRCKIRNISPELLAELRNVPIERVEVGSTDDAQRIESGSQIVMKMMVPFFFMYLIFMGIFGMGQHILISIIEEKNSRVIEVLLSALSPFQLMGGKILGLAGIGLTVVSLWAVAAYLAARWQGLHIDVSATLILYFAVYYALGFLFFSSILAGIGSICNTIKETQSLMMPIMLVFMLPLLAWFKLVQDPNGTLTRVLSFVPPLTPMVMILRLSASADIRLGEILFSIVLLAAAVLAAMWAAAKVFQTGILMYGKRPGLREVARWLRQT